MLDLALLGDALDAGFQQSLVRNIVLSSVFDRFRDRQSTRFNNGMIFKIKLSLPYLLDLCVEIVDTDLSIYAFCRLYVIILRFGSKNI